MLKHYSVRETLAKMYFHSVLAVYNYEKLDTYIYYYGDLVTCD